MHPDLLHHLSRTITERRPTGMALALAAISARTVGTPMHADLILVLTDACTLAHLFGIRTTLRWDFSSDVTGYDLQGADKTLLPLYLDHGVRYGTW